MNREFIRQRNHRTQKRKRHRAAKEFSLPVIPSLNLDNVDSPEERAVQLRTLLQSLGVPYSCFAIYLSSRIDLLPAEYCRALECTPDHAPPLSNEEVLRTLTEEFGGAPHLTFPSFNFTPVRSSLIAQYHEAEIAGGLPVLVAIRRPEFRSLEDESPVETLLDVRILRKHCRDLVTTNAVEDFVAALRRKVDFKAQAEQLESMARENLSGELIQIRTVYRQFSTRRVLTVARSDYHNLDQVLQSRPFSAERLATLICLTWLQHALFGQCFPVDPQYQDINISDTERIVFTACDLTRLPRRTKENLWNYLLATMADDPDEAARLLLREMSHTNLAKLDFESFRSNFRQSACFGALEPLLGTDTNSCAQLLFHHWQTATGHGYTTNEALLSFYRGLFLVARIARKVWPTGDPLRQAIEEIRISTVLKKAQDLLDLRSMAYNSDKFAIVAARMPGTLDAALNRASASQDRGPRIDKSPSPRNAQGRLASLLAFCLLLVTVCVMQSQLTRSWTSKFGLLVLLLAGLVALRGMKD